MARKSQPSIFIPKKRALPPKAPVYTPTRPQYTPTSPSWLPAPVVQDPVSVDRMEYTPKHTEYTPKHIEYTPKHIEYTPTCTRYWPDCPGPLCPRHGTAAPKEKFPKIEIIPVSEMGGILQDLDKPELFHPVFDKPPMLYEGNFGEWWRKMEMMLIGNGHFTISISAVDSSMHPGDEEAVELVKRFVRRELWQRVPLLATYNVQTLVPELRKLADKPFRLQDLPTEIRLRIYDYALRRPSPVVLQPASNAKARGLQTRHYQPALSRVSRKVREEAMQVLFEVNIFRMALEEGKDFRCICTTCRASTTPADDLQFDEADGIDPVFHNISEWAARSRAWLRHLRAMEMIFSYKESVVHERAITRIAASYDPVSGLQMRFKADNPGDPRTLQIPIPQSDLDAICDEVNAYGKDRDIRGEVMAMAFGLRDHAQNDLRMPRSSDRYT